MMKFLVCLACTSLFAGALGAAETPESIDLIRYSAERGNRGAALLLGLYYRDGQNVPRDDRKAAYWLERAAQLGHPHAQSLLGNLAAEGRGTARDPARAVQWWEKASLQGDAAAQLSLGRALLEGTGVAPDPARAEHWLTRAAQQDQRDAQVLLGRLYQNGFWGAQNLGRGREWLERAAARGQIDAIRLLEFDMDIDSDPESQRLRADTLRHRAETGDTDAQYQLGLRCETGAWGERQSTPEALRWFNRAADAGHTGAMRSLQHIYEKGLHGVAPDPRVAAQWRERAAGSAR
jgi:uncharacterized protein